MPEYRNKELWYGLQTFFIKPSISLSSSCFIYFADNLLRQLGSHSKSAFGRRCLCLRESVELRTWANCQRETSINMRSHVQLPVDFWWCLMSAAIWYPRTAPHYTLLSPSRCWYFSEPVPHSSHQKYQLGRDYRVRLFSETSLAWRQQISIFSSLSIYQGCLSQVVASDSQQVTRS